MSNFILSPHLKNGSTSYNQKSCTWYWNIWLWDQHEVQLVYSRGVIQWMQNTMQKETLYKFQIITWIEIIVYRYTFENLPALYRHTQLIFSGCLCIYWFVNEKIYSIIFHGFDKMVRKIRMAFWYYISVFKVWCIVHMVKYFFCRIFYD